MEYFDHLIDERSSQFWPVSDEQQALSGIKIEGAGGDSFIFLGRAKTARQAVRALDDAGFYEGY